MLFAVIAKDILHNPLHFVDSHVLWGARNRRLHSRRAAGLESNSGKMQISGNQWLYRRYRPYPIPCRQFNSIHNQ